MRKLPDSAQLVAPVLDIHNFHHRTGLTVTMYFTQGITAGI